MKFHFVSFSPAQRKHQGNHGRVSALCYEGMKVEAHCVTTGVILYLSPCFKTHMN